MDSIAPSRIRSATTVHSRRSPRYLGKMTPSEIAADLMARASDPLQPGRYRRGCLDLDHEIDGSHVDAEFE